MHPSLDLQVPKHISSLLALAIMTASPVLAEPKVVVSIKPLHGLVASVMLGVGSPDLLIDGTGSPHTYNLKPSDANKLQQADVVFWVGPELETFLEKPLRSLASNAKALALMDQHDIKKLPLREGNGFDHHDHGDEAETGHEEFDAHVWLDPDNAKQMLEGISNTLAAADPGNAATYVKNAATAKAEIDAVDAGLKVKLAPLQDLGFIVFHDAYQYFEKHYGLVASGSISINPENPPGAAGIAALQERVRSGKIQCVFAEPQFDNKLVNLIVDGSDAKIAELDPLGVNLQKGPGFYPALLQQLASSFERCGK